MVVFGAGASYDSVPHYPPRVFAEDDLPERLPLANQLFDNRSQFVSAMRRYPECRPVVPWLRELADGVSLESELQRLQEEASETPERHRQLAAIGFYLHEMLWGCEVGWLKRSDGVTNHKTLLDQIRHYHRRLGGVCLVTFNYDRMIEDALSSVGVAITDDLASYIASDFPLIKLHGSVDGGVRLSPRSILLTMPTTPSGPFQMSSHMRPS